MTDHGPQRRFDQRSWVALASACCLLAALLLLLFSDQRQSNVAGILVKVGLMLAALWLALPGILSGSLHMRWFPLAVMFMLLFLVAARPRIFLVAGSVAIVALGINWLWRRALQNR